MSAHVELFNLTKSYPSPRGPAVIVRNFNLHIARGEFVCLIGHSGCGKSTVLSMLAGLNPPTSGGIVLAGRELTGPGPDRGVVFQSPCLLPWLSAFDNVMLGINQVFYTASRAERRQIAEYYLTLVGLADAMHRRPRELSQGMRQRVGIARAFALRPRMLLLDEPFGMLDALTRMELQQVLLDLESRNPLTALMVTHDVDEALFLADRVVMMTNGPAAEVGDILEIPFPRPRHRRAVLEHPDYYRLREHLIVFLNERAHHRPSAPPTPEIPNPSPPDPATPTRTPSPPPHVPLAARPMPVGPLTHLNAPSKPHPQAG
ncbi:MAG: ABC transporter ATP-binding protein [Verrucomicrobiae bacterium]|nr:ABC transporter ATP-binding protein [Verrucomicrobiae bacterium]